MITIVSNAKTIAVISSRKTIAVISNRTTIAVISTAKTAPYNLQEEGDHRRSFCFLVANFRKLGDFFLENEDFFCDFKGFSFAIFGTKILKLATSRPRHFLGLHL